MVVTDPIRIDFVCVENAGRSQMAAAFAERESEERGLTDVVEIHSAGTDPAETVRRVRDEVETKVRALFDEIERTAADRADEAGRTSRVTDAIKRAFSF